MSDRWSQTRVSWPRTGAQDSTWPVLVRASCGGFLVRWRLRAVVR